MLSFMEKNLLKQPDQYRYSKSGDRLGNYDQVIPKRGSLCNLSSQDHDDNDDEVEDKKEVTCTADVSKAMKMGGNQTTNRVMWKDKPNLASE